MRFSVITVCYQAAATIRMTLESVLAQEGVQLEYIVIDGGSTDGTLAIVQEYAERITKIASGADQGMYFALNKGLSMATGDVVAILHADDFYTDGTVLAEVAKMMRHTQADALYGDLVYVSRQDHEQVLRFWKSGGYKRTAFRWGWMPPHPSFFLKLVNYRSFGGFRTEFSTAADYELMLRMLYKQHVKCVYLPRVLVKMRHGGKSNATIENRLRANREDAQAWKVNNLTPYIFTLWLKPLRKLGQFFMKG